MYISYQLNVSWFLYFLALPSLLASAIFNPRAKTTVLGMCVCVVQVYMSLKPFIQLNGHALHYNQTIFNPRILLLSKVRTNILILQCLFHAHNTGTCAEVLHCSAFILYKHLLAFIFLSFWWSNPHLQHVTRLCSCEIRMMPWQASSWK